MAATRRAAIVLRDVDVAENARGVQRAHCRDRVLLFDIGVEGVVEDADTALSDALGIGDRLLGGVDQVGFEAVERFEPGLDAGAAHQRQDLAVDLGAAIIFGIARLLAGEHAQRLEPGARHDLAAQRRGAFDRALEVVDGLLPRRRFGRDRAVRLVGDDRDGGALEPEVVERLGQLAVVADVADVEHRHFHAVEAGVLQRLEGRVMLLRDVTRPQQHVDSDFHSAGSTELARVIARERRSASQTAPKMKNRIQGTTAIAMNDFSAA